MYPSCDVCTRNTCIQKPTWFIHLSQIGNYFGSITPIRAVTDSVAGACLGWYLRPEHASSGKLLHH